MEEKTIFVIVFLIVVFSAGFFLFSNTSEVEINDFDECISAGNPAMESYPRQCRDPGTGNVFVEEILDSWRLDGVELMQHETEGFYGCFGCGETICIDPIQEMKLVSETEERYCNEDFQIVENGIVIEDGGEEVEIVEEPIPQNLVINGKTLDERLAEAISNLHKPDSTDKVRSDFPDLELIFTDNDNRYPSNILPFEYFYSVEADKTFNFCAIERTIFVCNGKLEQRITDEELNDVEKCTVTSIYSDYV